MDPSSQSAFTEATAGTDPETTVYSTATREASVNMKLMEIILLCMEIITAVAAIYRQDAMTALIMATAAISTIVVIVMQDAE